MLEINGTFKFTKKSLSGEDYFVLSQMYLPLMGMDSFTVYSSINNMPGEETNCKRLLDVLSFDNIGLLEKALNKLEALGLVKEYYNKSKGTIFIFMPPLSGKSFLNNPLLQKYLITQIGEVEYLNLRTSVFASKIKGYEDITKSFDEVFKASKKKNIHTVLNINEEDDDNIRIKNKNFDYSIFKMLFSDDELKAQVLEDEEFERQILKISYQYQLNEVEMKDAVFKSIAIGKDLRIEDISRNAGYIYQNKVPEGVVAFQDKDVEVFNHDFSSDDIKILEVCKTSSMAQILASVSGGKASVGDIRDFNRLSETTGLSTSVINVLIFYLTDLKEEEYLSYTYIERVARNWMKANVKTAEDALLLFRSKQKQRAKGKTKIEKPEWMVDDNEKTNQSISTTELSENDKAEAERLKNKLFGGNS